MDIVFSFVVVACVAIAGYLVWANRESSDSGSSVESDKPDFSLDDEPVDLSKTPGSQANNTQTANEQKAQIFDEEDLKDDHDRWSIEDMNAEVEESEGGGEDKADPRMKGKHSSKPEPSSEASQPETHSSVSNPGGGNRRPETSSSASKKQNPEPSTSSSEVTDTGIRGISGDEIGVERVDKGGATTEAESSQTEPEESPADPLWLVGRNKNLKDKVYRIDSFPALVGRHPDSAVQLESGDVSRRHFRVEWDDDSHLVQPLDAQNATVLNEEQLYRGDQRNIGHEDYLQIGNTLFQFHLQKPDFGEEEDTGGKEGLQFEADTAQVSTKAIGEQIQKKLDEHDGDMEKVAQMFNLDKEVLEQLIEQFGD